MDPGDTEDPNRNWKRTWIVEFGRIVAIAIAAVVGLIVALVFVYGLIPHGELGTVRSDSYGESVDVTAANPLGIRVLSVTVGQLSTPVDEIGVDLTLTTNRAPDEMWIAAIRLDNGRAIYLAETSAGVFQDTVAPQCQDSRCTRTYVLVACWRRPTTEPEAAVYFGGRLSAVRAAGPPSANVSLDVSGHTVTGEVATSIAQTSGCDVRS